MYRKDQRMPYGTITSTKILRTRQAIITVYVIFIAKPLIR